MSEKPRLLVVSNVLPFPRAAGQQQRVYYKLKAFREVFDVTFLVAVAEGKVNAVREQLRHTCDRAIVLPSVYLRTPTAHLWHRVVGQLFALRTGLKVSNYVIGKVELSPPRVDAALNGQRFDCAVYEYWHAVDSVPVLRQRGAFCALDMHDILWQSYSRQLDARRFVPRAWKRRCVRLYRQQEERAWTKFDALIAINATERNYAREHVPLDIPVLYAPMGTDLKEWPYCWEPAKPPRVAYYGGLGSPHNQRDALICYHEIMPEVWKQLPEAELWVVGSKPPEEIRSLPQHDTRVRVTGFVPRVQDVLKTMSVVVCPWQGTYGFRSRIVEVMALGVPVVASPDAVDGMGLSPNMEILLVEGPDGMGRACVKLLEHPALSSDQSLRGRSRVAKDYSYERCYERLAEGLDDLSRRHLAPFRSRLDR